MSIKKRIFQSLTLGISLFAFLFIVYEILNTSYHLSYLVGWCIAWATGFFVATSFCMLKKGIRETILFNVCVIFVTFFVLAFIIGFILNITNWIKLVSYITFSFALSLFYVTIRYRCSD